MNKVIGLRDLSDDPIGYHRWLFEEVTAQNCIDTRDYKMVFLVSEEEWAEYQRIEARYKKMREAFFSAQEIGETELMLRLEQ